MAVKHLDNPAENPCVAIRVLNKVLDLNQPTIFPSSSVSYCPVEGYDQGFDQAGSPRTPPPPEYLFDAAENDENDGQTTIAWSK